MSISAHIVVRGAERAAEFYRGAFGAREIDRIPVPDGRFMSIRLRIGDSVLEAELIDEVEVGRRVAPPLRVALQVADTAATTDRLVAAGAALIAAPTPTPWNSLNSRLEAPAGLQITLFEELPPDPAP